MQAWNQKIMFPSDSNFVIRITDVEFGPSKSSGNNMFTLGWEIVSPESANIAGEEYDISGVHSGPMNKIYYPTEGADEEKTANCLKRLTGTGEQLGLLTMAFADKPELISTLNPKGPNTEILDSLEGMCFFCQMSPEVQPQRKNPTAEQIAAAKAKGLKRAEGDIQKHPVTGKNLITYMPKVREIFGKAENVGANKPY